MAGWASNNKWSLLGGIRSAAQIISYEIPAGMAIFPIVLLTGTLSHAGHHPRAGRVAVARGSCSHNPFTFAAFFIFFIAALAEGNRTPFDLPEAESELVAGYNTEYSGMRFALLPGGVGQPLRHVGASRHHALPRRLAGALLTPSGSTRCTGWPAFFASSPASLLRWQDATSSSSW